ncbi:ribonuclease III, partial [Vibrio cholerae O1]|nr:ribonuclease III [Vibrio cholerae O1]
FIQHVVIPHVKNDDYVKVIDYKTELQEVLQIGGETTISYKILKEEGQDHDRYFVAAVFNNGKELGRGLGKSKK